MEGRDAQSLSDMNSDSKKYVETQTGGCGEEVIVQYEYEEEESIAAFLVLQNVKCVPPLPLWPRSSVIRNQDCRSRLAWLWKLWLKTPPMQKPFSKPI